MPVELATAGRVAMSRRGIDPGWFVIMVAAALMGFIFAIHWLYSR